MYSTYSPHGLYIFMYVYVLCRIVLIKLNVYCYFYVVFILCLILNSHLYFCHNPLGNSLKFLLFFYGLKIKFTVFLYQWQNNCAADYMKQVLCSNRFVKI